MICFFFSLNKEEENILITSKLLENSTRKWIQLAYARGEMTHKHGFFSHFVQSRLICFAPIIDPLKRQHFVQ